MASPHRSREPEEGRQRENPADLPADLPDRASGSSNSPLSSPLNSDLAQSAGPVADASRTTTPAADPSERNSTERNKERWRLAWHYAAMTDSELEALAFDPAVLTEIARRALRSELRRRGLPVYFDASYPAARASRVLPRSRRFVTVRRFRDMPQALLAKSVLESAGIECSLADANIIRTDWLWSNMVGGIKLRVLERDQEEANLLLDDETLELLALGPAVVLPQFGCPLCQSQAISCEEASQQEAARNETGQNEAEQNEAAAAGIEREAQQGEAAAGANSLEATPPQEPQSASPSDPTWTCHACGHRWRDSELTA